MTFLTRMAAASRARVAAAIGRESAAALEARARAAAPAPALSLDGFDVIAELKLRSPALGGLAAGDFDAAAQIDSYAAGGAAAISVLTEPTEFEGKLAHLAAAATRLAPLGLPAMRKDFLTDPYQVLEARAAGAGGVLVIVTMLDDATVRSLVECARRLGMFVLLEAFDRGDLERLEPFDRRDDGPPVLAGVNCRDLHDLEVRFERFAELAPHLPRHLPTVAESGITTAEEIGRVAAAGYRLALIGGALMRARDPAAALAALVAAGRAARARAAACS